MKFTKKSINSHEHDVMSIKFLNAATNFVFVTCFHLSFLQIFTERSDLVSHWVCSLDIVIQHTCFSYIQ